MRSLRKITKIETFNWPICIEKQDECRVMRNEKTIGDVPSVSLAEGGERDGIAKLRYEHVTSYGTRKVKLR
jgi:hypothetical protein